MKKIAFTLSMAAAVTLTAAEAPADKQAVAKEGVGYIKQLGKELKSNLKKYLKQDPSGLQAAYFCSKSAQDLTQKVNAKFPKGVTVRRTALKLRNPRDKADATDIEVMKKMEAQIKAGTFKKKPVVMDVGGKARVYVPLMTQKACLKCHGPVEKIDPKVAELIKKNYPQDRATGFKEGDLRGVIVAELPVDQ